MSGSGSQPMDHLVWKAGPQGNGIVAVSLNYRLNIFGFLATDELSKEQDGISGNYGIMDQQVRYIEEEEWSFENRDVSLVVELVVLCLWSA